MTTGLYKPSASSLQQQNRAAFALSSAVASGRVGRLKPSAISSMCSGKHTYNLNSSIARRRITLLVFNLYFFSGNSKKKQQSQPTQTITPNIASHKADM